METKRFTPGSKLHVLFHTGWGQAKSSPDYDKSVWLDFDRILSRNPDVLDFKPGSPLRGLFHSS